MHEPGIKPNPKERLKNLPKDIKARFYGSWAVFGVMLMVSLSFLIMGETHPEDYDEYFRLIFFSIFLGLGMLISTCFINDAETLRKEKRVKEGLRSTWDDEDHDELEKRVKALEEKLKG